jgi:prophage DNA circulation protein
MAWRDELGRVEVNGRPVIAASFRGVPFYVEEAEREGGRRTVTHEFPFRDRPFVEDLGRDARTYPVTGYVLGNGYLAAKNALLDALEGQEGPGEFRHPYYGALRVIASQFRVRESTRDGGVATFSITFLETEETAPFPTATVAAPASVEASADLADTAVGEEFTAAFDVDGAPAFALKSPSDVIASASKAMDAALAPFVEDAQQLAAMKRSLDALYLDTDALIRKPWKVLGELRALLAAFGTPPITPKLGLRALLDAYGFTAATARPPPTTATRIREAANYDAILRLVRSLIAIQSARLAPAETYDSYDAAVTTREAIVALLDEQMEGAGDDSFAALERLRADLVRAVPGEASDLPSLVRYTPGYTVPCLVLAHRLYGDVSREADIVARNRVERPGFVLGGRELEVLSDA